MVARERGNIRALFARSALDGHDRGVINVISRCRDEGMEVIYIYFYDSKQVVIAAAQENVDVIGITSSIGQHLYVISELKKDLEEEKVDIPVIIGGVIPTVDVPRLLEMGVKRVFGPGSTPIEVVDFLSKLKGERQEALSER